jgi:hypothetical protein
MQQAPAQRFLFDFNSIFSPPIYFSERFIFLRCAYFVYSNQLVTMDNQMNMQQQMVISILAIPILAHGR